MHGIDITYYSCICHGLYIYIFWACDEKITTQSSGKMTTAFWWHMTDAKHLVHLKHTLFLQLTASSQSDLPPSNQHPNA